MTEPEHDEYYYLKPIEPDMERIANNDTQDRLLKTTSKQGLINLCKSLREQLAKERELKEGLQRGVDNLTSIPIKLNAELEKELELRNELVGRAFVAGRSKTSWEQFQKDNES